MIMIPGYCAKLAIWIAKAIVQTHQYHLTLVNLAHSKQIALQPLIKPSDSVAALLILKNPSTATSSKEIKNGEMSSKLSKTIGMLPRKYVIQLQDGMSVVE